MPVRVSRRVLDELLAFLRAEATPRIAWRQRAWLGRRAAFRVLEDVLLSTWSTLRNDDALRHALVDTMLDELQRIGGLDVVSAGRFAQALEDPVQETAPTYRQPWRYQGQKTPATTESEPKRADEPRKRRGPIGR